jgi:hypothetical protein
VSGPLPCGCDEDEFSVPPVKCPTCGRMIAFAFVVASSWSGVCECPLTIWRWKHETKALSRCVVSHAGIGIGYKWTEMDWKVLSSLPEDK